MKTQADLYEMAAKVMRMCDGVDIDWRECIKGNGSIGHYQWVSQGLPAGLVPCLAIVEGKPVFVGDELYHSKRGKLKIFSVSERSSLGRVSLQWMDKKNALLGDPLEYWSWNPPKPKTIMIEIFREDAEEFCGSNSDWEEFIRLKDACRKALES